MQMDHTIAIYVCCVLVFLGAVCAFGTIRNKEEIDRQYKD
jgi:hypothetical protein